MGEVPGVVYLALKPEEVKVLITAGNKYARHLQQHCLRLTEEGPKVKNQLRSTERRATTLEQALSAMGRSLDRQSQGAPNDGNRAKNSEPA